VVGLLVSTERIRGRGPSETLAMVVERIIFGASAGQRRVATLLDFDVSWIP
jgi:hypothetical protein